MGCSTRTSVRVAIVAVVVGVASSFAAAPVAGQDPTDEDPAIAGQEVTKVSGKAFGAEAEQEEKFLRPDVLDLSALLTTARIGDTASIHGMLETALSNVAAAEDGSTADFQDELGPEPEVELPSVGGGPISDSEHGLNLDTSEGPLNIADKAEAETAGQLGATGFAESSATVSGLGDNDFIEQVETECRADLEDVEGSTRIDSDSDLFPKHPDDNTVLLDIDDVSTDPNTGEVLRLRFLQVLNEQDEDDHAITVNGYHEIFNLELFDPAQGPDPIAYLRFEAIVGHAHCGIVPGGVVPVVVQPTFTG